MTHRLYRDDAYLLEFEARVTKRTLHEGQPAVALDRTAFYPESGGQPWDTGTLDGVPVVAVVESGDEILHVLAAPLSGSVVAGRVDAERRRDHREQHHGQHLLSRAFLETAGAKTVSFHLGSEIASIDLDREVAEAKVRVAEERTNAVVWAAQPVVTREVTAAEAKALGFDPPVGAFDRVRLVEVGGFDLQTCGGTHPRSTSEVGVVVALGYERYKGGSRVRFVCGQRALRALREQRATCEGLGVLLSAPRPGLVAAAQRALDELAGAQRRIDLLRRRLADSEARRLLAETASPGVVVATLEAWPAEDLRLLAQSLVAKERCVALLASRAERVHLVFAQSDGLPHDIPVMLRAAAARLGGKGGGKGNLAQGSGTDAAALEPVLDAARAALEAGA